MTKFYDEFVKLKQKEMSRTLEDICYKYPNPETQAPTKVPASHFEKEFGREIEQTISASVNRQFLVIMFNQLQALKKETPELFYKALLCIDQDINPKDMRISEQIALDQTWDWYSEKLDPKKKSKKDKFNFMNDSLTENFENALNSEELQKEIMAISRQIESEMDAEIESVSDNKKFA